jgi:hypothetical protein
MSKTGRRGYSSTTEASEGRRKPGFPSSFDFDPFDPFDPSSFALRLRPSTLRRDPDAFDPVFDFFDASREKS